MSRHVSGRLLNSDAVKDYVSEMCPVPLSDEFPLADEVNGCLHGHIPGPDLDMHINGADVTLRRLHHPTIAYSAAHHYAFTDLKTFQVTDVEDGAIRHWLARSFRLPRRGPKVISSPGNPG